MNHSIAMDSCNWLLAFGVVIAFTTGGCLVALLEISRRAWVRDIRYNVRLGVKEAEADDDELGLGRVEAMQYYRQVADKPKRDEPVCIYSVIYFRISYVKK